MLDQSKRGLEQPYEKAPNTKYLWALPRRLKKRMTRRARCVELGTRRVVRYPPVPRFYYSKRAEEL